MLNAFCGIVIRLSALFVIAFVFNFSSFGDQGVALRDVEVNLGVDPPQSVESASSLRTAIEKTHEPVIRRESEVVDEIDELAETAADEELATSELVTRAELETRLDHTKKLDTLDDEQKETIGRLIEQSIEWLKIASELKQKTKKTLAEVDSVPERLEQRRAELKSTGTAPELPDLTSTQIDTVEQSTQQIADALEKAREQLSKHQERTNELQATRKKSQEKQQELAEQLEEIEIEIATDPPDGISSLHANSLQAELKTHRAMLQAREQHMKAESKLSRAMKDIHPLQHDLDRRAVSRLEAQLNYWQGILTGKRQAESQRRVKEAKRKAREADPALLDLATRNAELAELVSVYNDRIREVNSELESIANQFAIQEKSLETIKSRVAKVGMNETIGVLLRSQYQDLIDDRPMRVRAGEIEHELPNVALELLQVREQRKAMWEIDRLTDQHASQLTSRFTEDESRRMVRELLETRRGYLEELSNGIDLYEEILADLHVSLINTANVTREHRQYINENVLWTRSAGPVSFKDVSQAQLGIMELFQTAKWMQVVTDTGNAIQRKVFLSLASLLGLTICLVLCDRMKDRITKLGQSKAVKTAFRFRPTAEVAIETFVLACCLPVIAWFLSWSVVCSPSASDLTNAIGVGLQWSSIMWMALSLLQQVTRDGGLAECHFGWHQNNLSVVRANLRLLTTFGLPTVFAVMVIGTFQDGKWVSSLGRLSFMAGMAVMALFMHRLLDPYRGARGVWAKRDVWLYKVRHLLHAICIGIPLAFTVLSSVGYVYSAHQLAYRAQLSLWLVLAIVLSHAMISRYLTIARRNAAVRHMQRKRLENAENDSDGVQEEMLDFQAIGTQLQRLLRGYVAVAFLLGASFVWADMVPALMILDRFELSTTTQTISEKVEMDDGSFEFVERKRTVPITLADVLLGLLGLVTTVVAARNIPGLLNITVFERLPIDYGTRYALTAVTRYLISLIGIVTAFYLIGITWGSVQWLVAAMTVGLGFGLQEIFANFVSGLIILTERPVRVGDMVTVGGVTGKVTRVQIRATTITDFDRRELVVPNKKFITEDVINWTLSDPITRVVLPVGIAYQCDPKLAQRKLLEIARRHHLVLQDPEPTAIFMGFGDSTLDLELRVFMVGRDNLFQVRDELNLEINTAFKAANLEIAFPQRDLHIRSVDAKALVENIGVTQLKAA